MHPVDEDRTRISRIDYFLDPKRFGSADRRPYGVELLFELFSQLFRVARRRQIALVRRLDSSLYRQRPPIRRRPRVAEIQPARDSMARARDSENLAHYDRNQRRRRLEQR